MEFICGCLFLLVNILAYFIVTWKLQMELGLSTEKPKYNVKIFEWGFRLILLKKGSRSKIVKPWIISWIVILIFSFIIGCLTFTDCESNRYLLSTISQSSAALCGIIFIVIIALADKKATGYIINKNVLQYLLAYIIVIISPMIIMNNANQSFFIKIILNLAVIVIVMLIPYFWKYKLNLDELKNNDDTARSS